MNVFERRKSRPEAYLCKREVQDLDQLRAEIDNIKNVDDLKATDQATGLILKPEVIERLNLNTEDGIHDRRLYLKEEHHWIEKQLVP